MNTYPIRNLSDTWMRKVEQIKSIPPGRAKIENVIKTILTFSISALPQEVTFQMSVYFLDLWTLCQKASIILLKDDIKGLFWAPCISIYPYNTLLAHWYSNLL